jgi:hypothetical protein
MRPTSPDRSRRRAARTACGLALILALAHGTTGCAHQLTNAEFAAGAVAVGLFVGVPVLLAIECDRPGVECVSTGSYTNPPAPMSTAHPHAPLPPASGR